MWITESDLRVFSELVKRNGPVRFSQLGAAPNRSKDSPAFVATCACLHAEQ